MSVKDLVVTSAEDNIILEHAFIAGALIENMQHFFVILSCISCEVQYTWESVGIMYLSV